MTKRVFRIRKVECDGKPTWYYPEYSYCRPFWRTFPHYLMYDCFYVEAFQSWADAYEFLTSEWVADNPPKSCCKETIMDF